MIRRIVKLIFYIKAPIKAFVVFHPVKAAKLWFAYVLGSALFGAGKRVGADGASASRWGKGAEATSPTTPEPGATEAEPVGANGGNGGAPPAQDEAAADAVPAGVSVPEGDQPS